MKLLQLHVEFKLSDEFRGTLSDALREMAIYIESPEADSREVIGGDITNQGNAVSIVDWQKRQIERLRKINMKDGSRAIYEFFIGDWPE